MANIKMLLVEADGTLADIVNMTVSLGEPLYEEPVDRIVGKSLSGVFPVSTGARRQRLGRSEWLVAIDAPAVLSKPAPLNN